ncbi:Retrovirus-related Pol polyprotein from transposon TNT 1-94 [Gossypium australe]|uniref:Retrovirus-related Pol polyprotein from transposon TNT 1-94 n=1 Tax=Gossypium australe TaxID=47621 RepID=A0A5B6VYB1_9ROSI|nr:Retrovirus-related Pol polyprotein from transposon TNT 1-94 [Gossypium australe]
MVIVRTFLVITASKNWELHQMGVHNAFLYSDLDKEFETSISLLVFLARYDSKGVYLSNCFHLKDLRVLKYFLGIEVTWCSRFLCQRKYALDIISKVGLLGAKPVGSPVEQNHILTHAIGELIANLESYQRLIGHLIYLAITHLDLTYFVYVLQANVSSSMQIVSCLYKVGVTQIGLRALSLDGL